MESGFRVEQVFGDVLLQTLSTLQSPVVVTYFFAPTFQPKGVQHKGGGNTKNCGTLDGHTDRLASVGYSPDGSLVATSSMDCTVRLWNVTTMACDFILMGHTGWVRDVAFSPGGDRLTSASEYCTMRLWSVATEECCLVLTGHEGGAYCIAYSEKGDVLASGSWDKNVRLWDVASGR
jgi:WD40 repeat protein